MLKAATVNKAEPTTGLTQESVVWQKNNEITISEINTTVKLGKHTRGKTVYP